MLNIILFGAPGSGKGTQSEKLIGKYGLKHISTGELLRAEIKEKTALGVLADSYISKGQLVPDDIVIGMLEEQMKRCRDIPGFIFDGFPRTLVQGKALDRMLAKYNEKVSIVLSLEVDNDELIQRMLKRGEILGRSDDNRETIEVRLRVYHEQTAPLKAFYSKQGKFVEVVGVGSVEDIFNSMALAVDRLIAKG
ncbi:MAG: adenylate kinase [Fermentimonas sp.]|jgi:adenylate kinase